MFCCFCRYCQDHPRIHGEHPSKFSMSGRLSGSPPHTRGTPMATCIRILRLKDHPRIHGEHDYAEVGRKHQLGSPPHTRGTPFIAPSFFSGLRITPAYTGNTKARLRKLQKCKDHPRIHGEHIYGFSQDGQSWGSPPHTRGTP